MNVFRYSPYPRLPTLGSRLSPILEEDEKSCGKYADCSFVLLEVTCSPRGRGVHMHYYFWNLKVSNIAED